MPLPYIDCGSTGLIDAISLYYDPVTDIIIVRRRVQNFSASSQTYPAETFNLRWSLEPEVIT